MRGRVRLSFPAGPREHGLGPRSTGWWSGGSVPRRAHCRRVLTVRREPLTVHGGAAVTGCSQAPSRPCSSDVGGGTAVWASVTRGRQGTRAARGPPEPALPQQHEQSVERRLPLLQLGCVASTPGSRHVSVDRNTVTQTLPQLGTGAREQSGSWSSNRSGDLRCVTALFWFQRKRFSHTKWNVE